NLSLSAPAHRGILDEVAGAKRRRGQADREMLSIARAPHRVGGHNGYLSTIYSVAYFDSIVGMRRLHPNGDGNLCARKNRLIARNLARLKPERHTFPVITHGVAPLRTNQNSDHPAGYPI